MVWYNFTWYGMRHGMVWFHMVWYDSTWYGMIPPLVWFHGIIPFPWYGMILPLVWSPGMILPPLWICKIRKILAVLHIGRVVERSGWHIAHMFLKHLLSCSLIGRCQWHLFLLLSLIDCKICFRCSGTLYVIVTQLWHFLPALLACYNLICTMLCSLMFLKEKSQLILCE